MSALQTLLNDFRRDLRDLENKGLRRHVRTADALQGPVVRIDGRECVNWCSNDYLGLSRHSRIIAAAAAAAREQGVGARASRLLSGTSRWHADLEQALAAWFGCEAALVFSSGYLANLGALHSLLGPQDFVLVDRLAHASLIDAARSTPAAFKVFRHNDADQALQVLRRQGGKYRRRVIVTEGVFSMDGDAAPIADLLAVAEESEAIVYLDDAHGAFAVGARGRGSLERAGIGPDRLLYMATLGKAAGCQGGFVAGASTWIEWLQNHARTFIYATAPAIPVAAAALEALAVMRDEPQRVARLHELSKKACRALKNMKRSSLKEPSHIIPVPVGEARAALDLAERLRARGIWCPAIRPPTVPEGTARLRVSLSAGHTDQQLDALLRALEDEWSRG